MVVRDVYAGMEDRIRFADDDIGFITKLNILSHKEVGEEPEDYEQAP